MREWFRRFVLRRRAVAFVVMGAAFLAFGVGSVNLLVVLKANLDLLATHGWQAAMDGGAQQLLELLLTAYLSMAAYVVFKACEYSLVHTLTEDA